MKKKIFSLLLAICLIIPMSLMLSACGEKVKTTVTAEEWTKALNFEEITNYSVKGSSTTNPDFYYEMKYDGSKISVKKRDSEESAGDEYFYEKVVSGNTNNYFKYSKNGSDVWVKMDINEAKFNAELMSSESMVGMFKTEFEKFTYNKKTKAYELGSLQMGETTLTNISIKFENGLLKEFSTTAGGCDGIYVVSYEPVTITLPTIS